LLDELTSRQLSEWEAYDRLDPIGEWRADFRMTYLVTNILRALYGKEGVEMVVPLDFMPKWDEDESDEKTDIIKSWSVRGWVERKRQTVEEMKQVVLSMKKQQDKRGERKRRINKPPSKRK